MNPIDLSSYRISEHESFYVPDFVTPDEEDYLIRKISESPQHMWKQLANRRLQVWGGEVTSKSVLFAQTLPSFLTSYPDIIARLKNSGVFASSPHGAPNHVIMNEYLPGQGIMPHEDGPAYYPVVATISLGSHSVFHYYHYNRADDSVNESMDQSPSNPNGNGRTINPTPVLSVLLERRSLIVSMGPMFTSHLHGIESISEDRISPGDLTTPPMLTDLGVKLANWDMLTSQDVKKVMKEGGVLKRGIRHSLTCRDVERVSKTKSFLRR